MLNIIDDARANNEKLDYELFEQARELHYKYLQTKESFAKQFVELASKLKSMIKDSSKLTKSNSPLLENISEQIFVKHLESYLVVNVPRLAYGWVIGPEESKWNEIFLTVVRSLDTLMLSDIRDYLESRFKQSEVLVRLKKDITGWHLEVYPKFGISNPLDQRTLLNNAKHEILCSENLENIAEIILRYAKFVERLNVEKLTRIAPACEDIYLLLGELVEYI